MADAGNNTTTMASITPGPRVEFSVGAIIGLGVGWLVILAFFIFWLVRMRRRFVRVVKADERVAVPMDETIDSEAASVYRKISAVEGPQVPRK